MRKKSSTSAGKPGAQSLTTLHDVAVNNQVVAAAHNVVDRHQMILPKVWASERDRRVHTAKLHNVFLHDALCSGYRSDPDVVDVLVDVGVDMHVDVVVDVDIQGHARGGVA
eukprot:4658343-Amphidinium_carterae.1